MSALDAMSARLPSRFDAAQSTQGGLGTAEPVTIVELACALVQVTARTGQAAALAASLSDYLGLTLPGPGASSASPHAVALWVQPGSWLIQTDPTHAARLYAEFAPAQPNLASWVEQTHGRVVWRLSGAGVRRVLARICRLDVHARAFAPGACAATVVGHVACWLRRLPDRPPQAAPAFDLYVPTSYSQWLLDQLTTAAHTDGWRLLAHPANLEENPS